MQCSNCGKIFKTILQLRQHEKRKTPCRPPTHHCSKCAKGFASYHSMWQHKQRCEKKPVDQPSQDLQGFIGQKQSSMDSVHDCSMCCKQLASPQSLWNHKQRCHGIGGKTQVAGDGKQISVPPAVGDKSQFSQCEEKPVDQPSQHLPGFIGQKQSSMDTIPPFDGGSEFGTDKPKSNATLDRVEVAPPSNCMATQVNQEDISEELAKKATAVQGEEIPHKTRKVRKVMDFIGEKEFNRLACQQPILWSNLPRNYIYKLEWVNRSDAGVAGNLTNADGITISVLLPKFVVDKILAITDKDVKIYIRPKGEDLVDIATQKKHICKNCKKELICRKFLERHEQRCTKVLRRNRNKDKTILCK